MFEFKTVEWLTVSLSAFLVGVSKTGIPGIGVLNASLLAGVIPARVSTGVMLPMLIFGDIFAVSYYRRHAIWSHLVRLMPAAAVGIILGYCAMGNVNDQQLRPIFGVIVLAMLAVNYWYNARTEPTEIPDQWWFAVAIGLLAGITTMMTNAAGPIMAIYLLAMRLPKRQFIGTGAWYFFVLNCFKVPFSAHLGLITPQSLTLNLTVAPLIMVGALAGIWILKRIPEKVFKITIQLLAAAAVIRLLL